MLGIAFEPIYTAVPKSGHLKGHNFQRSLLVTISQAPPKEKKAMIYHIYIYMCYIYIIYIYISLSSLNSKLKSFIPGATSSAAWHWNAQVLFILPSSLGSSDSNNTSSLSYSPEAHRNRRAVHLRVPAPYGSLGYKLDSHKQVRKKHQKLRFLIFFACPSAIPSSIPRILQRKGNLLPKSSSLGRGNGFGFWAWDRFRSPIGEKEFWDQVWCWISCKPWIIDFRNS